MTFSFKVFPQAKKVLMIFIWNISFPASSSQNKSAGEIVHREDGEKPKGQKPISKNISSQQHHLPR